MTILSSYTFYQTNEKIKFSISLIPTMLFYIYFSQTLFEKIILRLLIKSTNCGLIQRRSNNEQIRDLFCIII